MKPRNRLKIIFLLIPLAMMGSIAFSSINHSKVVIPYSSTFQDPIKISGNTQLDDFCASSGTDGLSWESAHVIENLEIDGGNESSAFDLSDTDRYLKIRDCTFINSKPDAGSDYCHEMHPSGAVLLRSCSNVNVTGCIIMCAGTAVPISSIFCDNISLTHCDLKNGTRGILLIETNECWISSNTIDIIVGEGITAIRSDYNIIFSNTGKVDGFYGVVLDADSAYNQVYNNCFKARSLRNNIMDRGTNNIIYDNKCNLIPGYSSILILFVTAAISFLLVLKKKKQQRAP